MASIETLLSESPKRGKMARVCDLVTLVCEWDFDLNTTAPLVEATLDLQHCERGSGLSLSGRTRSSYCREN